MKPFSGIAAVLLWTLALPAVATPPVISVNPFTPLVIAAGPGGCLFDVALVPQPGRPNNGKIIGFADGSANLSGAVFVTATNLATSKSISLNISGPAHFSVTDNTFTNYGPTFGFNFSPNLVPPSMQSVFLAHGKTVLQFDNSGNIVSVSFNGTLENVCDLLQ